MNGLARAEWRDGDFARGRRWTGACSLLGRWGKARNRGVAAGSCWRRERWSPGVPPRWVPSQGRSIRLPVTEGAPLPPCPPGWGTEYPLPPLASYILATRESYPTPSWPGAWIGRPVAGRSVQCWRNVSRERGAEVRDTRRPRPRCVGLGAVPGALLGTCGKWLEAKRLDHVPACNEHHRPPHPVPRSLGAGPDSTHVDHGRGPTRTGEGLKGVPPRPVRHRRGCSEADRAERLREKPHNGVPPNRISTRTPPWTPHRFRGHPLRPPTGSAGPRGRGSVGGGAPGAPGPRGPEARPRAASHR